MSLSSIADVTIRRAAAPDFGAVGQLAAQLVQLHHELDPQRFIPATAQTATGYGSFLASQAKKTDVIILVAEHEGEVVGYTYAGIEGYDYMALRGPAGALYDIVVEPGHRGQGIGRKLLDATVAALEAGGAPRIVLSTAEGNDEAHRLFTRAGFRRTMIEMTRESAGGEQTRPGQSDSSSRQA